MFEIDRIIELVKFDTSDTEQIASKMHSNRIELGEQKAASISTVTSEMRNFEYFSSFDISNGVKPPIPDLWSNGLDETFSTASSFQRYIRHAA